MLVSVVMAVYNGGEYLKDAVDSILNQSYKNLEFIIVNDASTDHTRDYLESIKDPRVRVFHQKTNRGTPVCLNLAISHANGEWIAIQDADDMSMPSRIQEQVNYLKRFPEVGLLGTFVKCICNHGELPVMELIKMESGFNVYREHQEIMENRFWGCPFCHGSTMYSKKLFDDVGGYNEDYRICQDYGLWLRMLEKTKAHKLPQYLYQYRVHSDSVSHQDNHSTYIEIWRLITHHIKNQLVSKGVEEPSFILVALEPVSDLFMEHVSVMNDLNVIQVVSNPEQLDVNKGQADAVVFLDTNNFKELYQRLLTMGWTLNDNLFKIWTQL
ncbi:glycosyltransferase [Pseudalkalibacillus sp. Hm43]|uniref:glycosyltransferase n=1 Tax=Pseudalkalibacillus sp. Hm43 TaxID=3450742 RepID=UPI003F44384B